MSRVYGPRPADIDPERREAMARNLERLAWLMDRAFHIPGTRITMGLDALLGLVPGAGDVLTGLIQTGLVLVALSHYKVPKSVAVRMMANVLIDTAVGAIPLVGDLFDVGFKANTRNVKLLESYRHPEPTEARPPGSPQTISIDLSQVRFKPPWRLILPIAAVLLVGLVLVLVGFVTVVRWLFHF